MTFVNEEWLPIADFNGYEVSNLGRVRSVARVVPHEYTGTRALPTRILSQRLASIGSSRDGRKRYPTVQFRDSGHKKHIRKVHTLVLETFIGPRPDNCVACHANDDPTDNRLENLRWDTCSANTQDAVVNGCHPQAKKTMCRQGHEYDSANTYFRPNGGRGCRACRREAAAKHRAVSR